MSTTDPTRAITPLMPCTIVVVVASRMSIVSDVTRATISPPARPATSGTRAPSRWRTMPVRVDRMMRSASVPSMMPCTSWMTVPATSSTARMVTGAVSEASTSRRSSTFLATIGVSSSAAVPMRPSSTPRASRRRCGVT